MKVSPRRIDHLVLAVHDIDAAAALYQRLGFRVGERNRHPWGTENRLIQLRSSFLELISVGASATSIPPHEPGRFSFGAFGRDYLEQREGFAMFVLDSADAKADAAEFSRLGIGRFEPFSFERKGRRPDGRETRVAFSLAFAMDPELPEASFFVCQHHYPENFWNADFQMHPNGAADVVAVSIGSPNPAAHLGFLSRFCGVPAVETEQGGVTLGFQNRGRLSVERRDGPAALVSFSVVVPDLNQQAQLLRQSEVAFSSSAGRLTVGAEDVLGVAVEFVPLEVLSSSAS